MSKKKKLWRGLGMTASLVLGLSITSGVIMEQYPTPLDAQFGSLSTKIETDTSEDAESAWNFKSNFTTAKQAFEGFKDFAIKESQETVALLKNNNSALPLSKNAKITMMGLRSYAPVYGNSGGSIADKKTVEDNPIYDCFKDRGFQLNPSMLKAYENYCNTLKWGGSGFGAIPPEYQGLAVTDDIPELSLSELSQYNSSYNSEYKSYGDAAIVVVGRPGGESKNYNLGKEGMVDGLSTTTGNIMGLSTEEKEIIAEAKANFDKVIVLINSTTTMEFAELKDDPDIDGILWVGYPGAYGFYGVADVLNGTVAPSAYLGDTFAKNSAASPAMQSFGNIPWVNAADFTGKNVNSYLVEAEGIYTGYRYYETRYADIVAGNGGAQASAGSYTNADGTLSTKDGTWNYSNEVVYPFGYGLSYTTFEQTLDSVNIMGDKKTASVTVTVKNTGDVAAKSVIQLYAQSPYTDYDKQNGVEKSAVQLMDFEKTKTLSKNESQTITMQVDMSNLASYDYTNAKTFIMDAGTYYFAIGNDSHDAVNNILAAQGKKVSDGMTAEGNADKTYTWQWGGGVDKDTFSVSKAGVQITNALSSGDSSMDLNSFMPGTVTYLSRSNWNGTFPKSYAGLSASGRLATLLGNDFIDIKTNDNTSDLVFGDTTSELTINDLKGADFDDPRWSELVDKVTVAEFLAFAQSAFHNIAAIPSVGLMQYNADDGPGGSDTHYFNEGTYQGEAYADAAEYEGYGTRVAPSPTNLAYSFNKELAYENGEIILGESTLVLNLPIMIGPGGNLHRHGYNGRGGEYYSEDTMLSGYIGSAVVQGAQSKGCLVNIKHAAFNDQEINRSGIAVFMNEQKARELELRNLSQMFEANGKPASFVNDETKNDTYTTGALGVMTSYNRIGAVPSSANYGVMVQIMRDEWDFNGYNVTDFTGVSLKAAPKESILYGTTAFCGFGVSVDYWNADSFAKDRDMLLAIKDDIHYVLYSLANSAALNGVNSTSRAVWQMTPWRGIYIAMISVSGVATLAFFAIHAIGEIKNKKNEEDE